MTEDAELKVSKIRNGTVIDHIPAGRALAVLKLLGITGREGHVVTMTMNVKSSKLGRKDLVKVENLELRPEQVNKLTLIAPTATINIVRDYKVVEKRPVNIPERIVSILRCINPSCITRQNREPGFPGLEIIYPLMLTEHVMGRLSIATVIKKLCTSPAAYLGIPKGLIKPGFYADLVIFKLGVKERVEPSRFFSKAKYTVFEGWPLSCRIMTVYRRGELVYDGEVKATGGGMPVDEFVKLG